MAEKAKDWLSDTSLGIAKVIRPSQIEMAERVENIFANKGVAFIEAGTGTGKSFAYLIPAILSGQRIVISTAKKTLQTQIFQKDLPFLTSKVKFENTVSPYSLLKGKSNYACKLRFAEFMESEARYQFQEHQINAFSSWLEDSNFADFALYGEPVEFESMVRVTECVKTHCPYLDSCKYRENKKQAGKAKILVVNHALLACDLARGVGQVLGPYDALVIDEAHQAPKYFREAFSHRLQTRQPDILAKMLDGSGIEITSTLRAVYAEIFKNLPSEGEFTLDTKSERLFTALKDEYEKLKRRFQEAGLLAEDNDGIIYEDREEKAENADPGSARKRSKYVSASSLVNNLIKMTSIILGEEQTGITTDYISYVESRKEDPDLITTPIEVGELVAPALVHIGKVVVTSATLATSDNFNYASRQFGIGSSIIKEKAILPSTFDYKNKSALYLSSTAPDPSLPKSEYIPKMAAEIDELLVASRGGAFVLCASNEDMNGFYEFLSMRDRSEYTMLRQTGNVDQMLSWFKDTPNSVLIGVKTLWEGIDVPGLGLRLVIIPRIPFPNRNDVVLGKQKQIHVDNLIEQGMNDRAADIQAWSDLDLQEAIMDLKQGAGRLIRAETDKGIVACLDKRMSGNTKKYSGKLRTSLPQPPTYDKPLVLKYLTILAKQAGAL